MSRVLVCIEPLRFVDGVLSVGGRVERVEPTDDEIHHGYKQPSAPRGGLLEDERNDIDKRQPTEWVVVVWKGKRRRVPLRAFAMAR